MFVNSLVHGTATNQEMTSPCQDYASSLKGNLCSSDRMEEDTLNLNGTLFFNATSLYTNALLPSQHTGSVMLTISELFKSLLLVRLSLYFNYVILAECFIDVQLFRM